MKKDRVLVVEADPEAQRLLRARLLALDYDVQVADRGEDGIVATAEFEPDLVLLAAGLPGLSAVDMCARLREWTATPIIILGDQEGDQGVAAMDAGADGHVAKPLSMAVLLAHIRAILRRSRAGTSTPIVVRPIVLGNLTIDIIARKVVLEERTVHLTPTEFDLLRILATHVGRILTHRELLTDVWGAESATDTQYLHTFVGQLRRKLEPRPDSPRHILTEPGVGYQFAAENEGAADEVGCARCAPMPAGA